MVNAGELYKVRNVRVCVNESIDRVKQNEVSVQGAPDQHQRFPSRDRNVRRRSESRKRFHRSSRKPHRQTEDLLPDPPALALQPVSRGVDGAGVLILIGNSNRAAEEPADARRNNLKALASELEADEVAFEELTVRFMAASILSVIAAENK